VCCIIVELATDNHQVKSSFLPVLNAPSTPIQLESRQNFAVHTNTGITGITGITSEYRKSQSFCRQNSKKR